MDNLYSTHNIVDELLRHNEKTRNSDNYLYFKVIEIIAKKSGFDAYYMTIPDLLLESKAFGFPAFETVRRTRQKIQHDNPELAGNSTVEAHRTINEERFREYARGINV